MSASTTFDFPEPFGPTTQVIPGSRRRVVDDAKDLKPLSVMLFKYTRQTYLAAGFTSDSTGRNERIDLRKKFFLSIENI